MAGLGAAGSGNRNIALKSGSGLLGPLALSQYAALAALRRQMFVNGWRSHFAAFELSARLAAFVLYSFIGLAVGVGAGAYSYVIASEGNWQYLPIVFWAVCLIWQFVPIMLSTFQEQFDLGSLLRFPVGFGSYFLLTLVFGLADVSTIIGSLCCVGILIGVTIGQPALALDTAASLLIFAAFNILMVRAVFAWIDRWLSQRRTREIAGALIMLMLVSLQLLNPAVWQHGRQAPGDRRARAEEYRSMMSKPWVRAAGQVQAWLPPGLAARAVQKAEQGDLASTLELIGCNAFFVLAAGAALGVRLRAEYRGENLGAAPAREKAAPRRTRTTVQPLASPPGIASPIGAIVAKEFRTLLRTLPLLYAIGAPLIMVLIISGSFMRSGMHGHMSAWAFPLSVFFAQLGYRQLFSNSLGTEGAGIQLYFLAPTPLRTVLLAKNLCHSAAFLVSLTVAGFLAILRLGRPDPLMVLITFAWLIFALPVNLSVGNILSITLPYRVNPGRISRQSGSQGSTIIGLLIQVGVLGVGAAVFAICSTAGMEWLAIPAFLLLSVISVAVWLRILRNSDQLAADRKDMLLATLMRAE